MSEIYRLPSGKPFSADIRKNVGNALTGPNPQPAPKTAAEARQQAMASMNKFVAEAPKADTLKYDKPFTFNSDVTGQNFERYYSHPQFKKLGFSPFRDNETVYNQNSSLWDDTVRAGKYYPKLVGLAVSGTFGNWDELFSATPDVDNSIKMERYMNMASSSRDGFGAKALNFGVNSAYTVGIIGSIVAEEAVLAGVGATGIGSGVAVAGTTKNILKLNKAFDRLTDVFRAGSNITEARKTWDAVGKVSKAILPFQNTANLFRQSERAAMGWNKMDDYAKAYHSFGGFFRDLREINLVTSESKLEGGFVQNEVANDLIKEFRAKNGRDPNDQESKKIYDQAREAGFSTSYANMAGIYASNKVVLDKLLKGVPVLGQVEHAASKSVRGSIVKNANWLKEGKNPFEVLYGAKKYVNKEWLKQSAKNIPKNGLRYMSANLMEGTQEVYQEATAEAMKQYYIDTYYDPNRAHQGHMMASIKNGLKSQMSGRGLETFLSGALMAGPIQVVQSGLMRLGDYGNLVKLKSQAKSFDADPKNAGKENPYTKKINEYKEWDTKVVDALNDLTKNKKENFSKLYRNAKEQKDLADIFEDASLNDDTKTAIDTKEDSLFGHINTLRRSGTLNLFKEQLQSLSELSNTELAEAFNESEGTNSIDGKNISERVQTALKRIDEIDEHLTNVEKIANPYDARQDFFKWFGFEEARKMVAYHDYTYKRIGGRMTGISDDIQNTLGSLGLNPNYSDIASLFNVGRDASLMNSMDVGMTSEIDLIQKEIESLTNATDPVLKRRKDVLLAKKNRLQNMSVAVQNYVQANKLMSDKLSPEEADDVTERISVAEQLLYDSFKDHLTNLGVSQGKAGADFGMFNKNIDELFNKYKDYWRLEADKTNFANAINMLYNPELYGQAVDRFAEAASQADIVKAEKAKEAAVAYKKRYATNDFLNDLLSQYNVFVSEDEAEAYLANNIVPSKFVNADTGYELDPRRDKETYDKILDLIDKYDEVFFEESGERLFKPATFDVGARIAGTSGDKEIAEFVPEFAENDKRTLSDLAQEFGFSKGRDASEVKLDTVLNAIINSKYTSQEQKELARKLITLTDKTDLITFKQNHYTNSTYDTTNGIIVDARYSSKDYDAKVSVPIEYSILNGVMQKVITDALADTKYASQISELRKLAIASIDNDTEKALFKYALANDKQFVAELLTNGDFQTLLQNMEYTGDTTELTNEAKSMWSKFLDILAELFKDVLNIKGTVYNEALNVTLNKLAQPKTSGPKPGEGGTKPTGGGTSTDMDTKDAELMQKLRDKYDSIIAGMPEADRAGMNFDSWRVTDSAAIEITKKHKADKIRQQAGQGTGGGGEVFVEAATKRKALTAIGYTFDEINRMSEDEVNDLYSRREELAKGFVPNLNSQDWGEIDTAMEAAKKRVADMNLKLTADVQNYVQYDENDQPIAGTERKRISNVVKEPLADAQPVASARGNIIDGLFKDFLQGKLQSFEQFKERYTELQALPKNKVVNFSDEMLEDLFDSVRTVQKALNKRGIKVIADFPILSGMLGSNAVAGEMDILAYNQKGKVFIIDIKSAFTNRRLGYDVDNALRLALGDKYSDFTKAMKENDNMIRKSMDTFSDPADKALIEDTVKKVLEKYGVEETEFLEGKDIVVPIYYPIADRAQQLGYKELLRQSTGLEADFINIFPITTARAKAGTINSARMLPEVVGAKYDEDGNKILLESDNYSIRVDASKSIYELGIPGVTQTVTTYPENPIAQKAPQQAADVITDDVYNDFVDNNNVPEEILNSIADKVMKRESLSQRETAIFNGKTGEINEIIKQKATPVSDIEIKKADIEAAYSYITTRKYEGDRRDEVNKVGEDLAKRFVADLKEKGIVKEGFRTAERTDGSVEKVKVNTDAEGNNLGNDWSTAGKFKDEFRKFIDAELAALEGKQLEEEPTPRESAIQAAEELIKTAPTKAKNIRKDIEMMRVSDGFIGSKAPETKDTYVSATEAYQRGWGTAANPSDFTGMTAVMISGSGTWNPKQTGGKINNEDVNRHFELFYKPLINKAIQQGVTTFNIGNAAGMDKVVSDYLESNGFQKTTKGEWNEFKKEKIVNPTRTYDNKPIAKGLKGKVIYITPDSYTTGDMKTHSEDLVAGDDLVNAAILGLDQEGLKTKLESLSKGSGRLANAAGGLLNFIKKTGISEKTLDGKNNFKYLLAVLQSAGETSVAGEIYGNAMSEARRLAKDGKTVVFDNINILKYGSDLDLAILNSESDIAKKAVTTPGGKTAIAFAENAYQGTKKRVFTDSAESIITGGAVSKTPKALKDLRATVNKITAKSDLPQFKNFVKALKSQGVLEDLLEDQGLTEESFDALINQKENELSNQLTIDEIVSREGEVVVKFLNKKGEERIGLVVGKTEDNKLEIKDITKEYTELNRGDLLIDVDDLSYAGLGSKAKSSKLAERDVNERVLSIIESEKVSKPEKVTKTQSNTTQKNVDAEREAQKDNLKDFDPFDKAARKNNDDEFKSC